MKEVNLDELVVDVIKELLKGSDVDNAVIGFKAHNEYCEMTKELNDDDFMEQFYAHVTSALEGRCLDVPKMLRQVIKRYSADKHKSFLSNF